jgi:type VI secretion system secreted protein Hcp
MALNMFIAIDSIKGESQDRRHKDEIDLLSWSWGMAQSVTQQSGGGGRAGKVSFKDLTLTKRTDAATSALMLACSSAMHIKEAILTVRKAGENDQEFVRLKLNDIIVSSVTDTVQAADDAIAENVTLSFAKVAFEYFRQRPNGTLEPVSPFRWDIRDNRPG